MMFGLVFGSLGTFHVCTFFSTQTYVAFKTMLTFDKNHFEIPSKLIMLIRPYVSCFG